MRKSGFIINHSVDVAFPWQDTFACRSDETVARFLSLMSKRHGFKPWPAWEQMGYHLTPATMEVKQS